MQLSDEKLCLFCGEVFVESKSKKGACVNCGQFQEVKDLSIDDIRVVDDEGHLLFIYSPATRCIEYIPVRGRRNDGRRKVLCIVSTDKLRSIGSRNVISDSPVHEFVAEVRDV